MIGEEAALQSTLKLLINTDLVGEYKPMIKMIRLKRDLGFVMPQCDSVDQLLEEYARWDGARPMI